MRKFLSILLFALLGMVVGCSKDGVDEPNGGKYSINGSVQKGPFVLGSTINIQSLNDKLNPTGQSYTTSTNDDAGQFDLGSALSNKYAEIIATGYYFDEVKGDLSQGTLTLRSITDLQDGGATNVNLLTTLIYNRTQNLVKNSGKSIADATAQAERELFLALGIEETDIPDVRCAKMDISQAGDHNALLLTISVALQYNRSTAALSELIAKLATDLADDGQIARNKVQSLYIRKSVDNLAKQVRSNLIGRYNQLGAQNNVPHFDKYLGYFLDIDGNGIADKVDFAIMDEYSTEFSAAGGEYTLSFSFVEFESCEFSFSEDSADAEEWLTIDTDGGVCQLIADYNLTTEPRSAEIIIKERGGDASLSFHVSQQASFHIDFAYDATASADEFGFISDVEHFTTEINDGNGILFLTSAPNYIDYIVGPFISITIPECVTSFAFEAFSNCDTLREFKGKWASEDGRYLADGSELLYYITTNLTDFTVPQNFTAIGIGAFYGSDLTGTVTIPASVAEIKDYAFAYCNNISLFKFESMTPPVLHNTTFEGVDNLQISIPVEAVESYLNCDWPYDYRRAIIELADINNIPDSCRLYYTTNNNQKLGVYPEDGRTVLSHNYTDGVGMVVFFEPLTTIGDDAFYWCSSLTSITIPDSVTTIGERAFYLCSSLTSVTIGDGVTTIGESAFYWCSSLTSVTIGDGVTTIGESAFGSCDSLESLYISDIAAWCNVSFASSSSHPLCTNGGNLYINNELVTYLTIPDGITSIGNYTFYRCWSLESVTIGDGVTSIGYAAFKGCRSLTSVTIGDSVTTIGDNAFSSCNRLESLYISDIAAWCNVSFASSSSHPLCTNGGDLYINNELVTYLIIPDGITSIGNYTFYYCDSLESIIIPDSVTTIGNYTFYHCDSLESIIIPDSVTTIGDYAFNYCVSLTSVTIGDGVTTIGDYTFGDCGSLESVTIGDGVISIGSNAFANCSLLKRVNFTSATAPVLGSGVFSKRHIGCVFKVLESAYNSFLNEPTWADYTYRLRHNGMDRPFENCVIGDLVTVDGVNGVVFYTNEDIVYIMSVEQVSLTWSTEEVSTKATDHTNGMYNTNIIKSIDGWEDKYPAFKWCADLGDSWYLPACAELKAIYDVKDALNVSLSANGYTTLGTYYYWSSTEYGSSWVSELLFSDGNEYLTGKYWAQGVRAVLAL